MECWGLSPRSLIVSYCAVNPYQRTMYQKLLPMPTCLTILLTLYIDATFPCIVLSAVVVFVLHWASYCWASGSFSLCWHKWWLLAVLVSINRKARVARAEEQTSPIPCSSMTSERGRTVTTKKKPELRSINLSWMLWASNLASVSNVIARRVWAMNTQSSAWKVISTRTRQL